MRTTLQHREILWEIQRGQCWLCAAQMRKRPRGNTALAFSLDHVIPRSRSGPDDIWNKLGAHTRCNNLRQNNPPSISQALAGLGYISLLTEWMNDNPQYLLNAGISRGSVVHYLHSVVDSATPWACLRGHGLSR